MLTNCSLKIVLDCSDAQLAHNTSIISIESEHLQSQKAGFQNLKGHAAHTALWK
jgi:hypothetical protein